MSELVIISFATESTGDIFNGINSKRARRCLEPKLFPIARRKLDMLDAVAELKDLKSPPSNHLEALRGDRKGKYSIRINDQYRIVFRWSREGVEEVEITDYH